MKRLRDRGMTFLLQLMGSITPNIAYDVSSNDCVGSRWIAYSQRLSAIASNEQK